MIMLKRLTPSLLRCTDRKNCTVTLNTIITLTLSLTTLILIQIVNLTLILSLKFKIKGLRANILPERLIYSTLWQCFMLLLLLLHKTFCSRLNRTMFQNTILTITLSLTLTLTLNLSQNLKPNPNLDPKV